LRSSSPWWQNAVVNDGWIENFLRPELVALARTSSPNSLGRLLTHIDEQISAAENAGKVTKDGAREARSVVHDAVRNLEDITTIEVSEPLGALRPGYAQLYLQRSHRYSGSPMAPEKHVSSPLTFDMPSRYTSLDDAKTLLPFPLYVIPSLAIIPSAGALVDPGVDGVPAFVISYVNGAGRTGLSGAVWVVSSGRPVPTSHTDVWRTIGDREYCEETSEDYYRCKVRTQVSKGSFVQIESTMHSNREQVLALLNDLRPHR
jgi:hypothetical protein